MMGVNLAHVKHDRKYSVDDLQLMVDFFRDLYKGDSKHKESIKELLALAARKSPETGSAEIAENQRSHVAE